MAMMPRRRSLWLLPLLGLATSEDKDFPVTKVVTLLQDMQDQLEKEADADEEVYEKMDCWCKTNDREKTTSLSDAQTKISQLTTTIETTTADSARLKQEIAQHNTDLQKSEESLASATKIRETQVAEFNSEEKDMIQSVKALDSAIVILSKHQKTAPALLEARSVNSALATVKSVMQRHQDMLLGIITPKQRRLVLSLGQQPAFRQIGAQPGSQSGEIFGILRQMKETFEGNLAETQKDEAVNRKAFEELKAAKESEIKATQSATAQKTTQLAEAVQANALAQEELEDTQNQMSMDDSFLLDLKERCANTRTEYDARVAMRQQELTAIAEAIKILNDDQARDTFSKVMNFFQTRALRRSRGADDRSRRQHAAAVLAKLGAKDTSGALAAVVAGIDRDPIAKVKAVIDTLISELQTEKKMEEQKRDFCITRANENEQQTATYMRDKSDLETKIDGLSFKIKEIDAVMETLNKEITEMKVEIKRKGEDREIENKEFQSVIRDQQEMQALLAKALQVLKRVYTAKDSVAAQPKLLLQVSSGATPPPPPEGFATYGANRGSGGVVGMIEQITSDAKALEVATLRDEQEAQKDYESFIKDTNTGITTREQQKVNKNAEKSSADQELITAKEDLKEKVQELQSLATDDGALHLECDFLVNNYETRMQARDQEIEALQEAKAVLSGMRFDE